MKISSLFLAALLVCSIAGSALAAEASAPAPALSGSVCVDGDAYFGPDESSLAAKLYPNSVLIAGALKKAGYKLKNIAAAADGCFAVEYQAPGRKGYPFESMSAQNPSINGVSCADAARVAIDNYVKGTRQSIVAAGIRDLGRGKCRFSVYAVRPPSDALPASLGAVKLPQ